MSVRAMPAPRLGRWPLRSDLRKEALRRPGIPRLLRAARDRRRVISPLVLSPSERRGRGGEFTICYGFPENANLNDAILSYYARLIRDDND